MFWVWKTTLFEYVRKRLIKDRLRPLIFLATRIKLLELVMRAIVFVGGSRDYFEVRLDVCTEFRNRKIEGLAVGKIDYVHRLHHWLRSCIEYPVFRLIIEPT